MKFTLREPVHIVTKVSQEDGWGGVQTQWQKDKLIWINAQLMTHYKLLPSSHDLIKQGIAVKDNLIFKIMMRHHYNLKVADRLQGQSYTLCLVSDPIPTMLRDFHQCYGCAIKTGDQIV